MVYGLETMRRINADEAKRLAKMGRASRRPRFLSREIANRPWTSAELKGKLSVYDTYAEGMRAPFGGKDVLADACSKNGH